MSPTLKSRRIGPIWVVFVIIAAAVVFCSATATPEQTNEPPDARKPESVDRLGDVYSNQAVMQAPPSYEGTNPRAHSSGVQYYLMENIRCGTADRVYKKAVALLSAIHDSSSTQKAQSPAQTSSGFLSKAFSSVLPNPHGQGPISSAIRIVMKLRHQSWLPRVVWTILGSNGDGRDGGAKTGEGYRNTAAVISLLKHATSLGHTDAMFTLASISLVRRPPPRP